MEMKMVLFILFLPLLPCFGCHPHDRTSLLDFKQGFNFTLNREYNRKYGFNTSLLESWSGFNCCAWEGVACHPCIAHDISLDLGLMDYGVRFWSEIRGGLFQLLHLELLDLFYNWFNEIPIPLEFHKLTRLKYLNLYGSTFTGEIPREIANMSSLKFFDLSYNDGLESNKFGEWITHLRGLEYLGLNGMNFTLASDSWGEDIGTLANLKTLDLFDCGLSGEITPSIANLSRLEELDLTYNS